MAKLTDTQLIVLSKAAARDDGIAIIPPKMNRAAASKVGSSLIARKLMREVRSKSGMPVWREDDDNRSVSLMITRVGRDAIGVEDVDSAEGTRPAKKEVARPAKKQARGMKAPVALNRSARLVDAAGSADHSDAPRAGTKQVRVIEMLRAKKGATLDALVEATGWLPHTTRAALTGLRKRGYAIERSREDGEDSVYRIVAIAAPAAA